MSKQCTFNLLMIEPVGFGFNEETSVNNYFQQQDDVAGNEIQKQALEEFVCAVEKIRSKGVDVTTVKSLEGTPDSIFPNNWVSFHRNGKVVLYPMFAENRRKERRMDILKALQDKGFYIDRVVDYTTKEESGTFLEGTGSMVLDRAKRIAYAALSERTDKWLFHRFCSDFNYKPVEFHAYQTVDDRKLLIYHTNVMMSVAENYVVACLDTVTNALEKERLVKAIKNSNKELIPISEDQMCHFAGNCLQVRNKKNNLFLILSETAYHSLSDSQIKKISSLNEIIPIAVPTIEKYGGGSIRCMIAEIFLPQKKS